MRYDRKIKYFDYINCGECMGNGGFLKMNIRGEICELQIQISGLHTTDTFQKSVYLVGKGQEAELCMLQLQSGRGEICLRLAVDKLCENISYEELRAVRIPLAAGQELYCKIADDEPENESDDVNIYREKEIRAVEEGKEERGEKEKIEKEVRAEEENKEKRKEKEVGAEEENKEKRKEKEVRAEESEEEKRNWSVIMLDTKWKQLSAIYPHIRPFQDEREYLKIGPEDFVILSQRFYQLVHNSFLLHGYYNYQHMILTRIENRKEIRYYVGVPGNFYEREKQVAQMFGFESFECEHEPAGNGDYGYYMMPVEL